MTLQRETLHIEAASQAVTLAETRTIGTDSGAARLTRYQHTNHLGSAVLELDDKAQIISYEEYFPYGSTSYQAVRSKTETPKRYRYTGKERDEENDLSYHGARYYAPWLGRWTSCDPEDLADGVNVYAYTRNNPVARNDQTGTNGQTSQDVAGRTPDDPLVRAPVTKADPAGLDIPDGTKAPPAGKTPTPRPVPDRFPTGPEIPAGQRLPYDRAEMLEQLGEAGTESAAEEISVDLLGPASFLGGLSSDSADEIRFARQARQRRAAILDPLAKVLPPVTEPDTGLPASFPPADDPIPQVDPPGGAPAPEVTEPTGTESPPLEAESARTLRAALIAEIRKVIPNYQPPKGWEAHHIVPRNDDDPNADLARKILKDFGIDLDDPANGVFLPRNKETPNPEGATVHERLHKPEAAREYYMAIALALLSAGSKSEALNILRGIGDYLTSHWL